MDSEEDRQSALERRTTDLQRQKSARLLALYMERVKVYAEAKAHGSYPPDFQPVSSH